MHFTPKTYSRDILLDIKTYLSPYGQGIEYCKKLVSWKVIEFFKNVR